MSVKISIISLGAYGITAFVAQPQKNAQSILDIATLVFAFLMQLQYLDIYKSVYSKEWDPSTFCKSLIGISTKDVILPKNINDCLRIRLSRIFGP